MLLPGCARLGIQYRRDDQVENAAQRSHQVDDRVCPAAEGFGRHVGHQRHRGAAVGSHRDQQQAEDDDERRQLPGGGSREVAVIQERKKQHQYNGRQSPGQYEGTSPAHFGPAAVADPSKQRKQKQRQNVVRCHDHARPRFIQMKGVGKDQGNHIVVHLPERADRKKTHPDENGLPCIQFLFHFSLLCGCRFSAHFMRVFLPGLSVLSFYFVFLFTLSV